MFLNIIITASRENSTNINYKYQNHSGGAYHGDPTHSLESNSLELVAVLGLDEGFTSFFISFVFFFCWVY
jgi:hypothetical protein